MKKVLFVITLLLISISNVNAEPCDAYDIKRLKEIAEGVEITYELLPPVELSDTIVRDYYKIFISGLTDELVVVNDTDALYYNSDTNFNEIEYVRGGNKKIIIKSKNCGRTLKNMSFDLLLYNDFYNNDLCKRDEYKDLYVCQEWTDKTIYAEDFLKGLDISEKDDGLSDSGLFNKIVYYIIFCIIILVLVIIICLLIKRKRGKLE